MLNKQTDAYFMKNLLFQLDEVTTSVARKVIKTNPITYNGGAVFEKWEVKKTIVQDGYKEKQYQIVERQTGDVLANNIYLYEAAFKIARRLNQGYGITDAEIMNLLDLNVEFCRNYHTAIDYKTRMSGATNARDMFQYHIYEAKYQNTLLYHQMLLRRCFLSYLPNKIIFVLLSKTIHHKLP